MHFYIFQNLLEKQYPIKIQFLNSQLASYIFHIKQNLKKKIHPKIQSEYSNFIIEFDKACNTLNKQEFYIRWEELLCKYPATQLYLHNYFYPLHHSWAKCLLIIFLMLECNLLNK